MLPIRENPSDERKYVPLLANCGQRLKWMKNEVRLKKLLDTVRELLGFDESVQPQWIRQSHST